MPAYSRPHGNGCSLSLPQTSAVLIWTDAELIGYAAPTTFCADTRCRLIQKSTSSKRSDNRTVDNSIFSCGLMRRRFAQVDFHIKFLNCSPAVTRLPIDALRRSAKREANPDRWFSSPTAILQPLTVHPSRATTCPRSNPQTSPHLRWASSVLAAASSSRAPSPPHHRRPGSSSDKHFNAIPLKKNPNTVSSSNV